jgi:hypothetical protein
MVRLVTELLSCHPSRTKNRVVGPLRLLGLLVTCLGYAPVQAAEPISDKQPFLVSSTEPYHIVPSASGAETISLSTAQVQQIASDNSAVARLIESHMKAETRADFRCGKDQIERSKHIICLVQKAAMVRARQSSAANALKLHYGLAACLHAELLFQETESLLHEQRMTQEILVNKGIPISDPLLIDRLGTTLADERLKNESKKNQLRIQLSQLIGSACACSHNPEERQSLSPSDIDVCDHLDVAFSVRCDWIILQQIGGMISEDTLDAWNSLASNLSGLPLPTPIVASSGSKSLLLKLFRSSKAKEDVLRSVSARKRWLEELSYQRKNQIQVDVELAYEKKRTAALRWAKNESLVSQWGIRIEQLEALAEAKTTILELSQAKLNRQQVKAASIEVWYEWHAANIELELARGTILQSSQH